MTSVGFRELRSLDAIHLATAHQLGADLRQLITYDDRMATAARELGFRVSVPKQHARLVERRTVPCDASDAQPEVPSQLVLNAGIFSVCTQEWSNPVGWSRKFAITLVKHSLDAGSSASP